jgi:hypothetical protein
VEVAKIGSDAILLKKPFSNELLVRRISEVQRNAIGPKRQELTSPRFRVSSSLLFARFKSRPCYRHEPTDERQDIDSCPQSVRLSLAQLIKVQRIDDYLTIANTG